MRNYFKVVIFVFRFLSGVAAAFLNASVLVTIGEIASPDRRGLLVGLYRIFMHFGIVFEGLICLYSEEYTTLTYCTTALTILYFLTVKITFETPSHLVSSMKYTKAMKNLEYIRCDRNTKEIEYEFDDMKTYISQEEELKRISSAFEFITSKAIRKPLITASLLTIFHTLLGVNVISAYVPISVPGNEYVPETLYPHIINWLSLGSVLCTIPLFDRLSRRSLYIFGTALILVLQLINGIASYGNVGGHFDWVLSLVNVLVRILWACLLVPINDIVRSEIFPQTVKGFGNSICLIFQVVANVFGYTLYRVVHESCGLHCIYLLFGGFSILLGLVVYTRLPEGRRKYLAEIQNFG